MMTVLGGLGGAGCFATFLGTLAGLAGFGGAFVASSSALTLFLVALGFLAGYY